MDAERDELAPGLLEVVLAVMRQVRAQMREQPVGLSVSQFRMLFIVRRHPGASLSELAERVGLTLPTISHMIEGLVARGLVVREPSPGDRRRVAVRLTEEGAAVLAAHQAATRARLAACLQPLSPEERQCVGEALAILSQRFVVDAVGPCEPPDASR